MSFDLPTIDDFGPAQDVREASRRLRRLRADKAKARKKSADEEVAGGIGLGGRDKFQALLEFIKVKPYDAAGTVVPYTYDMTKELQQFIAEMYFNPPRNDAGYVYWSLIVASRQTGKSTMAENCALVNALDTPYYDHVCTADTDDRAKYLHGRVQLAYENLPEDIKPKKSTDSQTLALSLGAPLFSKMRTETARAGAAGLGTSPSSYHWSEVPFAPTAQETWALLSPALANNKDAIVCLEGTPAPGKFPSAEDWRQMYFDNLRPGPDGRMFSAFFPFWDSNANKRPWRGGDSLDNSEITLMDRYGPYGLQLENIAFMRMLLNTASEFKRDPQLFRIFYPFDDLTCWPGMGAGEFSPDHIEQLILCAGRRLLPWDGPESTFYDPDDTVQHIAVVDPCGSAARDHASFHIFRIWSDKIQQAYVFSAHVSPSVLGQKVLDKCQAYGCRAAIELNGVGEGPVAFITAKGAAGILLGDKRGSPGFTTSTAVHERRSMRLKTWIMDGQLTLHDRDTIAQMATYKGDKLLQPTVRQELLSTSRTVSKKRREKHHWDKVSALLLLGSVYEIAPPSISYAEWYTRFVERMIIRKERVAPVVQKSSRWQYRIKRK